MSDKCIYTNDGKVKHYSLDIGINEKLGQIIGEKFVKYREKWDAVNRYELVTDFPLFIQLDMHQNCNAKCVHCIKSTPALMPDIYSSSNIKPLSWEDYKAIINEGEQYHCPSISPCGLNEPLMLQDLEKYLKYASDHGFIDIMMNSNAALLTKERSLKLLDSGITRLRFSIDAVTAETYSKIRIGIDFNKVMRNIETFLELKEKGNYKLPIVGVNFCILSINEMELDAFVKYWENKVDLVTTQSFVPPTLDRDYSYLYPSKKPTPEVSATGSYRCPQPFQRVYIRNYDITPCCQVFSSKLSIGNLKTDTIYDSWNSKKMCSLREIQKNGQYESNAICKKCIDSTYLLNKAK